MSNCKLQLACCKFDEPSPWAAFEHVVHQVVVVNTGNVGLWMKKDELVGTDRPEGLK